MTRILVSRVRAQGGRDGTQAILYECVGWVMGIGVDVQKEADPADTLRALERET